MTSPKIRVGPWDCDQALHTRIKELRLRLGGQSWTWALHQGLKLLEEKHGVAVPAASGIAQPVEVSPVAVVPAPVAPVAPVLSDAEKTVLRLKNKLVSLGAEIETASARLIVEPGHIPSQTVMRVRPAEVEKVKGWLAEAEAELSSKPIDNGENEVEV